MRGASTIFARASAALLGLFAIATAASARTDGWDAVVELDREFSCLPIAAALQPLLEGKTSTRFVKVIGSLAGSADEIGVPVLYRNGGKSPGAVREAPIRACVPLIPTKLAGYTQGAPVADGSSLLGTSARIHFENVSLTVRCSAGQSRDFVGLFLGAGWLAGYERGSSEYAGGMISSGLLITGNLRIRFADDCDAGRPDGILPALQTASFLTAKGTGRAAAFINGLMRSDLTKLTLDVSGWPGDDNDDLCVVHHHSWGVRFQGIRCGDLGAGGLLVYGTSDSSYRDVYFTGNTGPGLMLGDPINGGRISSFDGRGGACVGDDGDPRDGIETCGSFSDAVVESIRVDGIVEGNRYGNVLVFGDVDRVRLDVRAESSASCRTPDCSGAEEHPMRGPNIGLFGGRCEGGSRAGLAGFLAARAPGRAARTDCPGGELAIPKPTGRAGSITFTGEIGGDRGFDGANEIEPDWNGIDLGAGFRGGVVRLQAHVAPSDVGCTLGCDDSKLDARRLAILDADSSASGTVDLTGFRRMGNHGVVGRYPFVRHDGERWLIIRPNSGARALLPRGDWIVQRAEASDHAAALACRFDLVDLHQRSRPVVPNVLKADNAESLRLSAETALSVRASDSSGVGECPSSMTSEVSVQLIPSGS
jgi:hypothetical protein